jgi:hypothetical protein
MGGKNYYASGQFNVICDICGKKIKAGEAKHRWDGFIVCPSDFEQRHSQDFVRARQDKISVPFTRPRPINLFVNACSAWGINSVADVGTSDCAQVDFDNTLRPLSIGDK